MAVDYLRSIARAEREVAIKEIYTNFYSACYSLGYFFDVLPMVIYGVIIIVAVFTIVT